MSFETIIVAFDDAAKATAAIQDVRRMGVPANAIKRHPAEAGTAAQLAAAAVNDPARPGFWSWMFGREAEERQIRLYQGALRSGGTVVSLRVLADEAQRVREVLEIHGPLDLKETASKL